MKLAILLLLFPLLGFAQINIGNGAIIRIQNSGKIVVMNPIPNGLIGGTSGGIITEGENAEVILKIGTATGTYNIPFATETGAAIPFKYNITTGGVGAGEIRFSSWGTVPLNTPLPAAVTFFTDDYGNDNSYFAIDRFWSINPTGYTNKPQGVYIFGYDVNEIQAPNTINEIDLVAQRWNDTGDLWGDWLYSNTANTTNKTVTVLIANPEDQYNIWTLVDQSSPLPIELATFTGTCSNNKVDLKWTTYTEIDNLYFVLEKSDNGYAFSEVVQINGAINSNTVIDYIYQDNNNDILSYYRLKTVSTEGDIAYSNIIAVSCNRTSIINAFPNPTTGLITITGITDHKIEIYDAKGALVSLSNDITELASGKYVLVIRNNTDYKIFKMIKR